MGYGNIQGQSAESLWDSFVVAVPVYKAPFIRGSPIKAFALYGAISPFGRMMIWAVMN